MGHNKIIHQKRRQMYGTPCTRPAVIRKQQNVSITKFHWASFIKLLLSTLDFWNKEQALLTYFRYAVCTFLLSYQVSTEDRDPCWKFNDTFWAHRFYNNEWGMQKEPNLTHYNPSVVQKFWVFSCDCKNSKFWHNYVSHAASSYQKPNSGNEQIKISVLVW